ncbi:MAG: translation initiation factor IF-2 N-terminal domain-containing protein, partial [Thermoguttaceae bacterium]
MLIRIYALAKQLKLDSKVLVDICAKAGVTGKGSALASLTDEEHATVMAFINSGKAARLGGPTGASTAASGPSEAASTGGAIRREDYIAPTGSFSGKVPVLPSAKHEKHANKPVEETPPPPTPESAAPAVEPPPPPVAPSAPPAEPTPFKRPVLRPSDRPIDRPKSGKSMAERVKEKRSRDKERDKDKGPAIKMAPLPAASQSSVRRKSNEPAPQKPDIKLPKDAIRAGRAGTKPLSEHLRKHEQKRAAEAAKGGPRGKTPPAAGTPAGELASLAAGRDRARRSRTTPVEGGEEEGVIGAMGGREQRQLKRKKAATARRRKPDEEGGDETSSTPAIRKRTHIRRTGANTAAPRRENVTVELPCTVRSFSEALGVPARVILAKLLELGTMSNIAATLDDDMAELLASELGVAVDFRRPVDLEQKVIDSLEQEDAPEKLQPRPPIVTFLGHVDHGKTSLLDRILGMDVAAHEKGGITQHIRAYRVMKDGRPIAFVDTPGHEAFTEMRARGANVTDIAVLVVAAEDGVMPQTEEAISHAKAAEVPIVVAMNKIDLPGANPQRVYEQLAANELLPSEWGGETEVVKTSAVTGEGIDKLLETLLTVAELHEYKANPDAPAR